MIPLDTFTPVPVVSDFLDPYDKDYDPNIGYSRGGVALNDGSQGREIYLWFVVPTASAIELHTELGGLQLSLPIAGATDVSLGFDSNMQPIIAFSQAGVHKLRYFDTLSAAFAIISEPLATSARCALDDARDFYSARSDVIWAYIKGDVLYYRVQRERYLTEHTIGPAEGTIIGMGPNQGYRLQFKITP